MCDKVVTYINYGFFNAHSSNKLISTQCFISFFFFVVVNQLLVCLTPDCAKFQVAEDDHDWTGPNGKTHKLRSRKGRSIVHKNLEDNYGAVIVANHEALAQVLENVNFTAFLST